MKSLATLPLLCLVTGCGVGAALNATTSMPEKLDKTSQQIDATNQKTDKIVDQISRTNDGMDKTNTGIHRQTLGTAITLMLSDYNTTFPDTPARMLSGAQIFADEATSEEITKFVYVQMLDVNESTPDALEKKKGETDEDFNVRLMDANAKANHDKFAAFTAAQVVTGLMSQAKTVEIVKQQVTDGGEFEATAYTALMLRHEFILNTLLNNRYFSNKLTNLGELEAAVQQARNVDYIEKLPFTAQIGYKISGMQLPVRESCHWVNSAAKLETTGAASSWKEILKQYDRYLEPKYKVDPANITDPAQRNLLQRVKAFHDEAQQKVNEWKPLLNESN